MKLIPEHAESLIGCSNYMERFYSAMRCRVKPSKEEIREAIENCWTEPRKLKVYLYGKGAYDQLQQLLKEEYDRLHD